MSGIPAGGFILVLGSGLISAEGLVGFGSEASVGKFGSLDKSMTSWPVSAVATDEAGFSTFFWLARNAR